LQGYFVQDSLGVLVVRTARTRGNQMTDDDVLLQAAEVVTFARQRRFGEHAGGLLERCRSDEGLRAQRGLRDALEHGLSLGRPAATALNLLVRFTESDLIHVLVGQERRVAWVVLDADFSQHLADDDLDVFR